MPPKRSNTKSATKPKAADQERVRNNQRRCRARQKQYITELENKILRYESATSQPLADLRLQEVTIENESLKRLLLSLGLGNDFLRAYSKAAELVPDLTRIHIGDERRYQDDVRSSISSSSDHAQHDLTTTVSHELQTKHAPISSYIDINGHFQDTLQLFESSTEVDAALAWEPFDLSTIPASTLGPLQTEVESAGLLKSNADALRIEECGSKKEENVSDTSTLCSWAFSLVLKNNTKGYSAADLDIKLRVGYRYSAAPSEGCRVDNKTLLSVLAEIS